MKSKKSRIEIVREKQEKEELRKQIQLQKMDAEDDLRKTDLLLFSETTDKSEIQSFEQKLKIYQKICKKKSWNSKYCTHCKMNECSYSPLGKRRQ